MISTERVEEDPALWRSDRPGHGKADVVGGHRERWLAVGHTVGAADSLTDYYCIAQN